MKPSAIMTEFRDMSAAPASSLEDGIEQRTIRRIAVRLIPGLMLRYFFAYVCLLNGIAFFLPQIVKGFGLSTGQTGLVMARPSLLALGAPIRWGRHADRHQERHGPALAMVFAAAPYILRRVDHASGRMPVHA